jgi:adenosylcobinamide hydrolase
MSTGPVFASRHEDGADIPMLIWRYPRPVRAIASGPLGGGIGARSWVVNATVAMSYARLDPDVHLAALASAAGFDGPGVGMLTGVDVADRVIARDSGVIAVATVGLGSPAWAAAPDGHIRQERYGIYRAGTVNIVVEVPALLTDAALVNAVATVAEAKAQALWESGIGATGTASDATCVLCVPGDPGDGDPGGGDGDPGGGDGGGGGGGGGDSGGGTGGGGAAHPYGGPRSLWGSRLARAVHQAVREGTRNWLAGRTTWSQR